MIENQVATSIDIIKIDDKENKITELKQENVEDDANTVTLIDYSKSMGIELSKYSNDSNSNNKNAKNNKDFLKIVTKKSNDEKNYKINLISQAGENENLTVNDIKMYSCSPKTENYISIDIDTSIASKNRKYAIVETNLEGIKQRLESLKTQMSEKQKIKTKFYATIDPNKNLQAENELNREISKDMFSRVSKHIITFYYYYYKFTLFYYR